MDDETTNTVPTIADVARMAQVSTATVSRCLNTPDLVQPRTRDKVMGAVRTLGYMPNFGARALVAKRTNIIGAVIPTMDNAIFARGLQAFQETLREHGITLLVASSQYRQDMEEDQIKTLIARGADGLLLIGYQRSAAIYAELRRRNLSAVIAWAYDPGSSLPAIGFDNRKAMRVLAREVVALGHRHVGVISATTGSNDRARERVAGVREAMVESGLPEANLTVVETKYSIGAGGRALAGLMEGDPKPSVVMCGNDVLAVGAIGEAKRLGYRVPDDLSVTGFDDIELAQVAEPPLTTVHVPHRKMGREAALALMEMIRSGQPAPSVELETDIRMRSSLGPAGGLRP